MLANNVLYKGIKTRYQNKNFNSEFSASNSNANEKIALAFQFSFKYIYRKEVIASEDRFHHDRKVTVDVDN